MLPKLVSASVLQHELDMEDVDCADHTRLVTAVDSVNWRYGKGTVHVASNGTTDKVRE